MLLCEMCPNTEFLLVRILTHSDQKKHSVFGYFSRNVLQTVPRSAVSILFGTTERYRVDEGPSENIATSLVLCFHTFFTIYLKLNLSEFLLPWLFLC